MRKLYLFANNQQPGWFNCYSIADDGHILGNHVCSHSGWMKNDLHDRSDRLETIKEHFNNEPYDLIIVPDDEVESHLGLHEAVRLNQELRKKDEAKEFEKAGVTIEYAST